VSLVEEGRMVSLSHDLDPADPDRLGRGSVLQRYMMIYDRLNGLPPDSRMTACREYIGIIPHVPLHIWIRLAISCSMARCITMSRPVLWIASRERRVIQSMLQDPGL
jgi:hypothetical protein